MSEMGGTLLVRHWASTDRKRKTGAKNVNVDEYQNQDQNQDI